MEEWAVLLRVRDSRYHWKAVEIEKIVSCDEIYKKFRHGPEHNTMFHTAYESSKHGHPFTDMPDDVSLQKWGKHGLSFTLRQDVWGYTVIGHIATEVKKSGRQHDQI